MTASAIAFAFAAAPSLNRDAHTSAGILKSQGVCLLFYAWVGSSQTGVYLVVKDIPRRRSSLTIKSQNMAE